MLCVQTGLYAKNRFCLLQTTLGWAKSRLDLSPDVCLYTAALNLALMDRITWGSPGDFWSFSLYVLYVT